MKPRLYIVSSPHYCSDEKANLELGVGDIQEVRLGIIGHLARTAGKGAYFSDGIGPKEAQIFNDILEDRSAESLGVVQKVSEKAYNDGGDGLVMYDKFKTLELLKKLRLEGVSFEIKPTELYDCEELDFHFMKTLADEIRSGLRFRTLEEAASYEKMRRLKLRDEYIVRNISDYGEGENILFVGSEHKFDALPQSGIEWYRLEVDRDNQHIAVHGQIPERFRKRINGMQKATLSNVPIRLELQYV